MTDSTASYEQHIEAARLANGRGDRAGTEQALQAAVQAAEALADGHLKLVAALIKLGELKHAAGNPDEAEALFRRALGIGERVLGKDDLALVPPLTSLGALRIARGAPEEAEPLLTRALAISERSLGRDHPDLVVLLNDLSRHYLKQSAYAFAEPLLLQLYSIKRSKGEEHPEVATVLASLAAVRQALGRHDAAEQLWRRVLDIRERTLAPNHFATATAIEHLAETCAARGKLGEALQLFQRALAMRELTLGAAHPSLRVSRERIADLQLQGSEESFDVGSGLLPGLSDWRLPTTPEFAGSAPAEPLDLPMPRPAIVRSPEPESRPAIARAPEAPQRPTLAPIAAVMAAAPAPSAAAVSPAIATPVAMPVAMPAPRPAVAPVVPPAAPAFVPVPVAAVATVVRAPEARPAFTPESDARPMVRGAESRLEYAPEAFADDEKELPPQRLFIVGDTGQPGASLIVPTFAGDLATLDEELAEEAENARFGNRARLALASAASVVRHRPMPVVAAGVGAAAIMFFAMGPGFSAQTDAIGGITPQQPATAAASALIADSAAGSLGTNGAVDPSAADRPASVPVSSERASSSADASTPKTAAKSETPERSTQSAPELPRALPGANTAQLDDAMRAAGSSSSAPAGDAVSRPAVTFSSDLLSASGSSSAAKLNRQAELIGGMPRIAYPQALRAKGREVQGQVLVEFRVDTAGVPDMSTLSVLHSDHELFTTAVRKAIPSMRFIPAQENGRKVRGLVTEQFRFSIDP